MRKCVLGWTVTPEVLDSWAWEGQTVCRLPQGEGTLGDTLRPRNRKDHVPGNRKIHHTFHKGDTKFGNARP